MTYLLILFMNLNSILAMELEKKFRKMEKNLKFEQLFGEFF